MGSTIKLLLFLVAFASVLAFSFAANERKVFDVRNYGARGDGRTDNAKAFLNAWNAACGSEGFSRVYVPFGTFYLKAVTFRGPCRSRISFVIKGTLLAPKDHNYIKQETWIIFQYVDYLTVTGGGILDGQGSYSWSRNDCKRNPNCRQLPMNMGFQFVRFSRLIRITSINSKMGHFNFFAVNHFEITKVKIRAPVESPNTDGIKIGSSSHMRIHNVDIGTGDDCIAILSGTSKLDIFNVNCGPGHGISVGSLGKYKDEKTVHDLTVRDSIFNGTSSGVRIKTWASSVSKFVVSNFVYKNLQMIDVGNPINIDQNYCPNPPCSVTTSSHVQIRNVRFEKIWGTSSNKIAVNLECSRNFPCKDVQLVDVFLVHRGPDGPATALCENVDGWARGKMFPPSCIN